MRENTKLRNKKEKYLEKKHTQRETMKTIIIEKIILRKTKDKYLEKKKYFGKKRETNKFYFFSFFLSCFCSKKFFPFSFSAFVFSLSIVSLFPSKSFFLLEFTLGARRVGTFLNGE